MKPTQLPVHCGTVGDPAVTTHIWGLLVSLSRPSFMTNWEWASYWIWPADPRTSPQCSERRVLVYCDTLAQCQLERGPLTCRGAVLQPLARQETPVPWEGPGGHQSVSHNNMWQCSQWSVPIVVTVSLLPSIPSEDNLWQNIEGIWCVHKGNWLPECW